MVIKNLQIFIRWAEKHEIDFEYSPYDAIDFNELTAMEVTDAPNEKSFTLPCLMADFSNLESLELNWLGLNQLPAWIENCKRLESLSLMGNEIETIPSWIENLSKLKKLDCRSNDLYFLPSSSTSLLELDVSFNDLEGFGSWEGNFPNLIKLNCSGSRMEEIPSSLLNLEFLEEFILEDSPNLSECSKELKHKIDLQLQERKKIKDREKKAYLDAFRGNTLNTYRRYLEEYPEGRYSEEARVKIEENSMKNFRKNVRNYYQAYYKNGDDAHLIDHADGVCDLALKINNGLDEKLIILASYLHDMFNATNRPTHNELAYELTVERILEIWDKITPRK